MEKIVKVEAPTQNLPELLDKLRKENFAVRNVGADAKRTYVYLEPSETKDPMKLLCEWMGLPSPPEEPVEPEQPGETFPLVVVDPEEVPKKVLFKKIF